MDSLFILGKRGNVVLEKHWRTPLSRQMVDPFWAQVMAAEQPSDVAPAVATAHHVLLHVLRNELCLIGVVARDVPPLLTYELLHRVADTFELYFRELTEEAIRDNFVTVYQLLDEMLDHGVPVHTEPNMLQELVLPSNVGSEHFRMMLEKWHKFNVRKELVVHCARRPPGVAIELPRPARAVRARPRPLTWAAPAPRSAA